MSFQKLSKEEIRKHKGTSYTGITTVFFCHDGKGNLFLTKRSNKTRDEHGRWDPGAGGLKHGQAIEENLHREIMEEYGVVPQTSEFIGYYDAFRSLPDGTPTHWLAMCFAVRVDPLKIKINETEMVENFGWFSLDDLPSPMHTQFEMFMAKYGDTFKHVLTK